MSLSAQLSEHFDAKTRARGRAYFDEGSVISTLDAGDGIIALVLGSESEPYEVFIADAPDQSGVDCSCPRFADGYLCKHIWATILQLESQGNGQASQKTTPVPSWKAQLRDVHELQQRHWGSSGDDLFNGKAGKRNEVWYAMNVGASLAAGELVVDLSVRETKKNGEFGKFKRLSVRRDQLHEFTLEDDRRALGWLLGNEQEASSSYSYGYRYGYYDAGAARIKIQPALFDHLLPLLAATGRFVWVLEQDAGVENGRVVAWDDGSPWQFQLSIDDDKQAKCWRIGGRLTRGDDVRALDAPVLLLAQGVVLWEDALARLDSGNDFAWIKALRRTATIEVPHDDRDELLEQLWSAQRLPTCELPASLQLEQVVNPPRGRFQVQTENTAYPHRTQSELFAKLSFEYGDQTVPLDEPRRGIVDVAGGQVLLRDEVAERSLAQQLAALKIRRTSGYQRDYGDVRFAKKRFADVVGALVKAGWIVEADGNLIRSAGKVSISVSSGVDWFELDGEIDFDGASAKLPVLLAALKKGEKYVRLGDGTQGMLPEDWLQKYGQLIGMGEADGESLRFRPTQAMLLDALLAAQENVTIDRGYRNFRKRLAKFDGVKARSAPRTFRGDLREYQKQGLGWLHFLRDFGFGGCLADDMGLGKTVQVLALLESRRTRRLGKDESRSPSLVVVPKSLVFNWIEEAARFTPNLRVLDYTGLGRKDKRKQFREHDVIITTYGTLRQDIAKLRETRFDYAILDESQAIKNAGSQAAKACRLIAADHRLAMTGTPVENHLGELWSLFEFLNPGMLGSSATAASLMKSAGGADRESLDLLRRALAPYILRRTKEQVLTELPNKSEQTLYCEMAPKQRKQYDELREYYRVLLQDRIEEVGIQKAKIHVLEALLRLRQAACHPGLLDKKKTKQPSAKLDTLLEQLDEIVDEGHKALIFSQFTSLLSIVRKSLDAKKIPYEYLDGRTRKRQEKVKRFQEDDDCPLFLISLKAGGHGLNLTAADYVYILDPWWNPAVEAQAVDRAHRIGQTRPVFAYRLICRDTVEEKIIELKEKKRDLADAIISADNSVIRSLTADDLQLLLS